MTTLTTPQWEANGDIFPRRFVIPVAGTNNRVAQATDGSVPILGVSGDNTRFASGSYQDSQTAGIHAAAGEFVDVHTMGQVANLDIGATAITDLTIPLTADANGKGTPATTLNWIGAIPLKLAAASEWIPVWVLSPTRFAVS